MERTTWEERTLNFYFFENDKRKQFLKLLKSLVQEDKWLNIFSLLFNVSINSLYDTVASTLNKLADDSKLEGPGKRSQYWFSKRQHWQLEKWARRRLVEFKLFEEEYDQGRIVNLIVHLWSLNWVWPLWNSYLGYSNTLWKHQLSANCWSKKTIKFEELSGEREKKTSQWA